MELKFYDKNQRRIEPHMKLKVVARGNAHTAQAPRQVIGTVARLDFSCSVPGVVMALAHEVEDFNHQRGHSFTRKAGTELLVSLPGEYNAAGEFVCLTEWQHPNWFVNREKHTFYAEIVE